MFVLEENSKQTEIKFKYILIVGRRGIWRESGEEFVCKARFPEGAMASMMS